MEFGNGFSAQNLANMRQFFITYSSNQPIFQTLSRKSSEGIVPETPSRKLSTPLTISQKQQTLSAELHFTLSWLHYLKLMRIENLEMINDYAIYDTADMYMKTAFPIHETGNMHTKTPNHIHVSRHVDIKKKKVYGRVDI